MKALGRISLVLISVFVAMTARSAATMIPHHSTYTNTVVNSDQTVTFTATFQGDSTSSSGGCPSGDHFYHAPAVFVNGTGGGGTTVAPCAYINLSQSVLLSGSCLTDGTGCGVTWSASVYCSFIGATIFAVGFPSFNIKLTSTYWGPPPIKVGDGCIYNVLACSTGVPTCKSATPALSFTMGCPDYVKVEYAVYNGTCEFGLVFTATKPGICN